jgi:CheY-like chemotaxis protein
VQTLRPERELDARALQGLEILVVDDDADARFLVKEILGRSGGEVRACASASEALALVASFVPDVIVSDLGMPEVDGYELLDRLRESVGVIPSIALSAYARPDDRTRALRAGYSAHVSKPVDPDDLISAVAVVTGRG